MRVSAALVFAFAVLGADANAQVADANARFSFFYEPSATSQLTVLNPSANFRVQAADWLDLNAGYEADIVSGATESVKAGRFSGVDVISSATSFADTRHTGSAGFTITRDHTQFGGNYAYGIESDYRSHAFSVSAATDLLQRNTELRLAYGRGFDQVCTTDFAATDAPSSRLALDSSENCFSDSENRATRAVDLDNLQVAWTQSWTPVLTTQLVVSGALQHGFLENPYRSVVIAPAGDQALEHHPDNRARGALALRGKYYVRSWQTALGLYARGYRDTWDIWSQTYEAEVERYLTPALRLLVRGRFYWQTGALFWSDDYTGGEPVSGPRGQYWTGDRELSPLASYSVSGRLLFVDQGTRDQKVLGFLARFSAGAGAELIKTDLREFTWGGVDPTDTLALLATLTAQGTF